MFSDELILEEYSYKDMRHGLGRYLTDTLQNLLQNPAFGSHNFSTILSKDPRTNGQTIP